MVLVEGTKIIQIDCPRCGVGLKPHVFIHCPRCGAELPDEFKPIKIKTVRGRKRRRGRKK